ncbi:hypothetical protein CSQ80_03005 [Cyanobacterium aponinum IPPAS B-1201]|nr:hypothetical protein CSQ80_03005 [Cyanobacterium aponinum IPPAS B-1201]
MCLQTKMSPSEFIHKWKITYSQLAEILDVDYVRIYAWMSPNKPVKVPSYYLAKIALADFFFEFYDFIPRQRLEDYLNN